MRRKNHSHQQDIDDLKKHNAILEQQSKFIVPLSLTLKGKNFKGNNEWMEIYNGMDD